MTQTAETPATTKVVMEIAGEKSEWTFERCTKCPLKLHHCYFHINGVRVGDPLTSTNEAIEVINRIIASPEVASESGVALLAMIKESGLPEETPEFTADEIIPEGIDPFMDLLMIVELKPVLPEGPFTLSFEVDDTGQVVYILDKDGVKVTKELRSKEIVMKAFEECLEVGFLTEDLRERFLAQLEASALPE